MSVLDKDRYRNRTISFRVSPTEHKDLEARIEASGIKKTQYYLHSCLYGRIVVVGTRQHVDRLIEAMQEMTFMLKGLLEELENGNVDRVSQEIATVREDYLSMVKAIKEIADEADKQVLN